MTSTERHEARYHRRKAARLARKQARCAALGPAEAVFSYRKLYRWGKKCCNNVRWKQSTQNFEAHLFSGTAARRKKLLEGNQPDRKKDWKKHAFGYRAGRLLNVLVAVVWVVGACAYWMNSVENPNEIPITEYQGELPYLRLSEIGVEGSFDRDKAMDYTNKITVSSDWLAGTVIQSNESGEFTMEDGRRIDCAMYVTYTDMRADWLARELAAEYPISSKREVKKDRFQFFDIPSAEELGVDSAVAYSAYPMGCAVVLVKGSEVWQADLMQFREDSLSIDEWVRMFAGELNR